MLTISELLGDLDVEVLAGEDALDAPVRWVHISELADPTPWLSGGELLLTTGLQLTDAPASAPYVERLAAHGLAGLGVGVGFAHEHVPEALVEAAARARLPAARGPYELPFIAITEQAFTRLVNEQYALLRRSIAAQERLQRVVLAERGLDGIVGALAGLVGGTALVLDARGDAAGAALVPAPARRRRRSRPSAPRRAAARARGDAAAVRARPRGPRRPRARRCPVAADAAARRRRGSRRVKDAGGLAEVDRLRCTRA